MSFQIESYEEHSRTLSDHDFVENDRPEWGCWMACGFGRKDHPRKGEPWRIPIRCRFCGRTIYVLRSAADSTDCYSCRSDESLEVEA
jgi:hypothetical protein